MMVTRNRHHTSSLPTRRSVLEEIPSGFDSATRKNTGMKGWKREKEVLPLKPALRNYCSASTFGRSPRPDQVLVRMDAHQRNKQRKCFREQRGEAIFRRVSVQRQSLFQRKQHKANPQQSTCKCCNKSLYSPHYLKRGLHGAFSTLWL